MAATSRPVKLKTNGNIILVTVRTLLNTWSFLPGGAKPLYNLAHLPNYLLIQDILPRTHPFSTENIVTYNSFRNYLPYKGRICDPYTKHHNYKAPTTIAETTVLAKTWTRSIFAPLFFPLSPDIRHFLECLTTIFSPRQPSPSSCSCITTVSVFL